MSGLINGLGWLEGRWLVLDMGDARVKIKAEGLSQSDVDALSVGDIGTPEEERQKARDERAKEYFDAMDLVDARQKQKEGEVKQAEHDRFKFGSEMVAAEPATLKRINLMAEVAKEFNRAADEATAYIEGVESYLEKMGFGIEVVGDGFVKGQKPPNPSACIPHLRFSKSLGRWGFVLHGGKSPVLLKQASRTGRILAARHIPALLDKMWERIVGETEKVLEHKKAFADDVNDKTWERE